MSLGCGFKGDYLEVWTLLSSQLWGKLGLCFSTHFRLKVQSNRTNVHKMASHKPSLPDYLDVGCSGGKVTCSFWCQFTLYVMVASISMVSSGIGAQGLSQLDTIKKVFSF